MTTTFLDEEDYVDVRIGVTYTSKELEVSMGDDTSPEEVRKQLDKALADGDTLWLTDRRGRQIGIPTEKLAYVEIGPRDSERRVGFGG